MPESGAFGAVTYNALNGGRYTRIGNVVHIQALLYTDSVTVGTANSDVRIGGLPFTAVGNSGPQDGISSLAVSQSLAWVTNQPTGALARQTFGCCCWRLTICCDRHHQYQNPSRKFERRTQQAWHHYARQQNPEPIPRFLSPQSPQAIATKPKNSDKK